MYKDLYEGKPVKFDLKSGGNCCFKTGKDHYILTVETMTRGMAGCISISDGIVHFLLPGFPATPPRNHNHPQLGGSTPTDGAVKGLLRLGYIGPHGGLAGA